MKDLRRCSNKRRRTTKSGPHIPAHLVVNQSKGNNLLLQRVATAY